MEIEQLKEELGKFDVVSRFSSLVTHWGRTFDEVDVILIRNGIDGEGVLKIKTVAIHAWLLRTEFVNTVLAISKNRIILLGSQEKIEPLKIIQDKLRKENFDLVLIPKTKEPEESIKKFLTEMRGDLPAQRTLKLGGFLKEAQKGKTVEDFDAGLKNVAHEWIEISPHIQELLSIKRDEDLPLIKKSAEIVEYFYKILLDEVEVVIDQEKPTKHSDLTKKIEKALAENTSKYEQELLVKSAFVDFAYSPIIQSGGTYNLKPNAESDDSNLSYDTIMLSLGAKYMEYNTNVVRTLLIDATEDQKAAYAHVYEAEKFLIKSLKPGASLKEVFEGTYNLLVSKSESYKDRIPPNFGYGIGLEFRESNLVIGPKSDKVVRAGMVFNVAVSLNNMETKKANRRFAIMLSDTVRVGPNGPEELTKQIEKRLSEIDYQINEEDGEEEEEFKAPIREIITQDRPDGVMLTRGRRRGDTSKVDESKIARLRAHQSELLAEKMKELQQRLEDGDFDMKGNKKQVISLDKIVAYQKTSDLPKNLEANKIHVDMNNNVIFLPMFGKHVPFHISTIKNVSPQHENRVSSLRFNFNVPGSNSSAVTFPDPLTCGYKPIYIKELTFRSASDHLSAVFKEIREVQKSHKQKQISMDAVDSRGGLITVTGRKPCLLDLKMRPSETSKRNTGTLEAHKNGFRFVERGTQPFEILFSNIKHCFYQPCDDELIILLHFHLKNAVVVGKKKVIDIQFYTEAGVAVEDLTENKRGRFSDFDEEEQDELERQQRKKLNKEFESFVKAVEGATGDAVKFEVPSKTLSFQGSTDSHFVTLVPTPHCLVFLSSSPFFVCTIDDIEVAFFERVGTGVSKSFDLVLIHKDYTKYNFIGTIPSEFKDHVQKWLDSNDILFFEGSNNIRWDQMLTRIRDDPGKFVEEDGGWGAFADDDKALEEENEVEKEIDSSFESAEVEGAEESDDWDGEEEEDDEEGADEGDEEGRFIPKRRL